MTASTQERTLTFQYEHEGRLCRMYDGTCRIISLDEANGVAIDIPMPLGVVSNDQAKKFLVDGMRVRLTTTLTVMGLEPEAAAPREDTPR